MIKETTNNKHPSLTIFQRLAQAAGRVRQGQSTPDDLILMLKHPELASVIVQHQAR
jgi:hypothetical protein